MQLTIFQVDAFSERLFGGNPAAVIPLPDWLPDATLQAVAAENNLSETAFLVGAKGHYALRWFTPSVEVDLCGHATLATAHVLYHHLDERSSMLCFETRSGELTVRQVAGQLEMNFPVARLRDADCPEALSVALGAAPLRALTTDTAGPTWLLVYPSAEDVLRLSPDFSAVGAATDRCVIVTAPGDRHEADFVSRFFGPTVGINEDPVTGSAHCALTPYWVEQTGRNQLLARQLSPRGGRLACVLDGDRVLLSGTARTYLEGSIRLD